MNQPDAMTTAVLYDARTGSWLQFNNPTRIITSSDQASVQSVFNTVETEVSNNNYAVGFVAYEAAPALNPALAVNSINHFPLVWFAIFPHGKVINFPELNRSSIETLSWQLSVDEDEYREALSRVKTYIHAGDTYQVNYSFRLRTEFNASPWDLFIHMIHAQGYGYGAYIDTGDWCICSASHELFFDLENTHIRSKPMKGTVPRGLYSLSDREQADWLKNSAKNRAENLMIVDMVRNDLGQIAVTGSVNTSRLFDIEKYPTLWQMTSTVEAVTRADIGDIFQALFPPASITGAPKARTMEIIAELEQDPRKIYTGSIGMIRPDRSAQFNVAIRTVLIDKTDKTAEYGVGGGIVWDSETQNELEECFVKAKVLTFIQEEFELLETMLWTPETGYFLLPYHLERLRDSADYFSWNLDFDLITKKLDAIVREQPPRQHRVRLRIPRAGEPLIDVSEIKPGPDIYRIHLAGQAIDPDQDLFLYHKTTRRNTYEKMLAQFPDYSDVLLFNQYDEVTESCIANLVVELDGERYTPPVACGLLPGTYRRYLLEHGLIREKVIKLDDLRHCTRLSLVNSVRGMWDVILVT